MAITLVEKGDVWPVKPFRDMIHKIILLVYPKFADVLDCTVCLSFWMNLFCDATLFCLSSGTYFFWPFSGFATLGFSWVIYQFLDSKDRKSSAIEELVQKLAKDRDKAPDDSE